MIMVARADLAAEVFSVRASFVSRSISYTLDWNCWQESEILCFNSSSIVFRDKIRINNITIIMQRNINKDMIMVVFFSLMDCMMCIIVVDFYLDD